jgi:hypothetical protein
VSSDSGVSLLSAMSRGNLSEVSESGSLWAGGADEGGEPEPGGGFALTASARAPSVDDADALIARRRWARPSLGVRVSSSDVCATAPPASTTSSATPPLDASASTDHPRLRDGAGLSAEPLLLGVGAAASTSAGLLPPLPPLSHLRHVRSGVGAGDGLPSWGVARVVDLAARAAARHPPPAVPAPGDDAAAARSPPSPPPALAASGRRGSGAGLPGVSRSSAGIAAVPGATMELRRQGSTLAFGASAPPADADAGGDVAVPDKLARLAPSPTARTATSSMAALVAVGGDSVGGAPTEGSALTPAGTTTGRRAAAAPEDRTDHVSE